MDLSIRLSGDNRSSAIDTRARILHEKTSGRASVILNFLRIPVMAFTFSTGLLIIFSQHLGNVSAFVDDVIALLIFNGSLFIFWSQPLQVRSLRVFGMKMILKQSVFTFYLMIPLALLMIGNLCFCKLQPSELLMSLQQASNQVIANASHTDAGGECYRNRL